MSKQLKFNEDARVALKKGIDKLAEAVKMTLGPRGRAAVIEKGYGAPQVTLDGVTVAKEIELEDKYENLGAEFIKQAASKTDDDVGDGTTTAIVLSHAMINEGEKAILEKGFNVIRLAEALKEGSKAIIEELEKQKVLIESNKDIQEVATLSAKDKSVGELIAKVMEKVGRDGVVTIEDSNTVANAYEIVEGMQFDRGYVSAYMITNTERMEAVLEDPYILVTDKKISSIQELVPVLEKIVQAGKKELVIIADEVDGEALATLIVNKIRGILSVLAVKAPGFGDRKKEMLEDIATVTGAEFITEDLGKKLESVDVVSLGRAHRVISNKDNTTIVGGKGEKDIIDQRVAQIKNQIKKTESEFDKEKLQERLGKLAGGVAVIKVGAPTETAQKELKQRVEDAVSATRAAMEEGIIPGGGIGLFNVVIPKAENMSHHDIETFQAALNILTKAKDAPFEAILNNSGKSGNEISGIKEDLKNKKTKAEDKWIGFNAMTNEISNLKEAGVIDPLKVTKTAFMNAVSVASAYLTIGVAIANIPEKKEEKHGPIGDY
ncbi:chaperonin GroEL [Candidatus Wolfebacteria bacterium CG10_big_fil_rev_8_21_14_0_10_31_9]|uniref:Chaperonin GroEL n=1 Tax=Candidatus Wolfebacteria bacterium CG10_big_fil_rev_8_21_14_0_10_31_9 TaxID=1975070 RepID=A0A2H0RBS8_9BACT|nr:MAG: chaperonin GroEL [Candidatus Wolfebacteria bacterium CG10_big_fil_rev_8_21_14_0_10_31_9]